MLKSPEPLSPRRVLPALSRELRGPVLAAIAFLVGCVYALTIMDPGFILARGPYWSQAWGDRLNNMIGALYFAHDSWHFPLFLVPKFSFPEGANIVFTDSLPLLAVFGRIGYQLSGYWFNYFGLWIFLCYPLLAMFAALAAKEAGAKEASAQIAVAIFAITCPALLLRYGHAALMGHFLIVWAILLYFRMRNAPERWGPIAQFCAVAALTLTLQAYFVIMVVPFFVAALAHVVVERRCSILRAVASLALVVASVLLTAWVAGIIGPGGAPATQWGFGHYSMNVLSPLVPPRDHLPEIIARHIGWGGGALTAAAHSGQYEGYNYVGAGLLLLAAVHLVASPRLVGGALRRHAFLVLLLLGYFAFALSNRIFFNDTLIATFPVPGWGQALIGHFRTGGRLFWPVYYVLAIALVIATFRRFGPKSSLAVVAAAVILQLADTQFLRDRQSDGMREGYRQSLPRESWLTLLESHAYLKQYPSFQCGAWAPRFPERNSNLELLWLAAQLDKPTNSAYLARLNRDCAKELDEGLRFDVEPAGLYVYGGTFPVQKLAAHPEFKSWCRTFPYGVVCSRNWNLPALASLASFKMPLSGPSREVPVDVLLKFSPGANGADFLGDGWSVREGWGVWTLGPSAEIALGIPASIEGAVRVTVEGYAFVHAKRLEQAITVFANGREIARWTYAAGDGAKTYVVDIPQELLDKDHALTLRLVPETVESPKQAGVSDDPRAIGFALMGMKISSVPAITAEAGSTRSK